MKTFLSFSLLLIFVFVVGCGPKPVETVKDRGDAPTAVRPEILDPAYAPKKIALLVGINDFEDEQWRSLRFAERDAVEFADKLKNNGNDGFDDVTVLTGPDKTNKNSILDELHKLSGVNTDPRDIVVVYFSTHGTLERDATGRLKQFLVVADTKFDNITGTAIDLDEIKNKFDVLRSRRKVLILATCHSGCGKSELNDRMAAELRSTKSGFFIKPLETVSEASVMLSACAWGETAREDETLQHDIYTHFFLEALGGMDTNEDGAVTVSEAHDYAKEKTYYFTNGRQRATAVSDVLGSDPIVLSGKISKKGKPTIYSYDVRMEGIEVLVNGVAKGKLPGSIVLEPGEAQITLMRSGVKQPLLDRKMNILRGKNIDVGLMVEKKVYMRQTVGAGASYRSFINSDINDEVYGPMWVYGMTYGRAAPWRKTMFEFSLYGGSESQTVEIDDIDREITLTMFDMGVALLYRQQAGRLALMGGPALDCVYFQRDFDDENLGSAQEQVTGSFGITLNFGWLIAGKFQSNIKYTASIMPVELDGDVLTGWYNSIGMEIHRSF